MAHIFNIFNKIFGFENLTMAQNYGSAAAGKASKNVGGVSRQILFANEQVVN